MSAHVPAVNAVTEAWLSRTDVGVLSGAGLWPLLAILAAGADPPGRAELAAAVGVPAEESMDAAAELFALMDDLPGLDAALGLWTRDEALVRPQWRAAVPSGVHGRLTGDVRVDQPVLDAWANERTHSLIERFPVDSGPAVMLILATALALRTSWVDRFAEGLLSPRSGAWSGRRLAGLSRWTPDPDDLRLAATPQGPLTISRVVGEHGLDVHLVLGPPGRPVGPIVAAALPFVVGGHAAVSGSEVLDGSGRPAGWPGVSVVRAPRRGLELSLPRFEVRSEHDLLEHADLFGLTTVSRPNEGHFSPMAQLPLWVDQARQAALARFTALGFEAAAVTAIGLRTVSAQLPAATAVRVEYDRPFGFVASHRDTGLVVFAGGVDSPDEFRRR